MYRVELTVPYHRERAACPVKPHKLNADQCPLVSDQFCSVGSRPVRRSQGALCDAIKAARDSTSRAKALQPNNMKLLNILLLITRMCPALPYPCITDPQLRSRRASTSRPTARPTALRLYSLRSSPAGTRSKRTTSGMGARTCARIGTRPRSALAALSISAACISPRRRYAASKPVLLQAWDLRSGLPVMSRSCSQVRAQQDECRKCEMQRCITTICGFLGARSLDGGGWTSAPLPRLSILDALTRDLVTMRRPFHCVVAATPTAPSSLLRMPV